MAAGATLIPLLSLGIPGDVVTAVILGAFMVHGLRPGPILFQQNLDMIYALFIGILFSSVALFVLAKLAIRGFAWLADISNSVLYPVVFVIIVYGTYAVNTSYFDLLVMTIMGLLGFAMLKFDIPPAPFLIAFVLGPLLEDGLRRSLSLSGGSLDIFFQRPITLAVLLLATLAVILLVRRTLAERKLLETD